MPTHDSCLQMHSNNLFWLVTNSIDYILDFYLSWDQWIFGLILYQTTFVIPISYDRFIYTPLQIDSLFSNKRRGCMLVCLCHWYSLLFQAPFLLPLLNYEQSKACLQNFSPTLNTLLHLYLYDLPYCKNRATSTMQVTLALSLISSV